MYQLCKEPDWRLSGKVVTASSAWHLAGSERRSKSVYRELYSAVTSTRQATAASHSMQQAGGGTKHRRLTAQLPTSMEKSLLDLSSGTGPELAAW